jgi:hypothetical protein
MLEVDTWPDGKRPRRAWLGSAVAIKDPTAIELGRQSGANLLIVGHREEESLGVLAAAVLALAAQDPPGDVEKNLPGARFVVLDGRRPDAPEAGFWRRLSGVLPHRMTVVRPRGAAAVIEELAEELSRRQSAAEEDAPPIYLVVDDLGRFRDLRKADDDFGFSSLEEGEKPSPARQFVSILREGPVHGIHALIWCDTFNNVSRWLDRQSLRDLELRACFQMNATDSSNLIDSPLASRLGVHRAVFCDEGLGHVEKFRPYGLPADDWLVWVHKRLAQRPLTRGQQGDAAVH